jgi:hypothetical protein
MSLCVCSVLSQVAALRRADPPSKESKYSPKIILNNETENRFLLQFKRCKSRKQEQIYKIADRCFLRKLN